MYQFPYNKNAIKDSQQLETLSIPNHENIISPVNTTLNNIENSLIQNSSFAEQNTLNMDTIDAFRTACLEGDELKITSTWSTPALKSYYAGKPINLTIPSPRNNKQSAKNYTETIIGIYMLIDLFNKALFSRKNWLIEEMLVLNPWFKEYFTGHESWDKNKKDGMPYVTPLTGTPTATSVVLGNEPSEKFLLKNLESALFSNNNIVIGAFLINPAKYFFKVVKNLSIKNQELLLLKVLACLDLNESATYRYILSLTDINIIIAVQQIINSSQELSSCLQKTSWKAEYLKEKFMSLKSIQIAQSNLRETENNSFPINYHSQQTLNSNNVNQITANNLYNFNNFNGFNGFNKNQSPFIVSPNESELRPLANGFPLPNGHGSDLSGEIMEIMTETRNNNFNQNNNFNNLNDFNKNNNFKVPSFNDDTKSKLKKERPLDFTSYSSNNKRVIGYDKLFEKSIKNSKDIDDIEDTMSRKKLKQ